MSANGCVFPPLPAGPVVITSQDTYANATSPLSVVSGGGGGGGGGPNLVVSTLTAKDTITCNILYASTAVSVSANSALNLNNDIQGQSAIMNIGLFGLPGIQMYGDTTTSSLKITAQIATPGNPNRYMPLNVGSLINVSSINGAAPGGSGGGPNIVVSSIALADIPSGTNIIGNISCSSLTPGARLTMAFNADYGATSPLSHPILFNDYINNNIGIGQLQILKRPWSGINGENITGLAINAYSSITGAFQPLCCGDLYVNNSDGGGDGTGRLTYIDSVSSMQLAAAGGGVIISSLAVSSINGAAPGGTLPTFEYSSGLTDGYLSSFTNVRAGVGAAIDPFTYGMPLTPYISTQQGHVYQTSGCFEISSLNMPATSPNAYLYIWGGGGPGQSWNNQGVFPYPMVSTAVSVNGGLAQFQWNAPGGFSPIQTPGNGLYASTMRYILCASSDWAVPVGVNVSSLIGRVTATDLANITTTDFGQFSVRP